MKEQPTSIFLLFTKIETTGKYYWQNCIRQMSFIIEVDGVEIERLEYKVKPHPAAIIDDSYITEFGLERKHLIAFDHFEQKEVLSQLKSRLGRHLNGGSDRFYVVAYDGCAFDMHFLRSFFKQCGDSNFDVFFWETCIDPMVLATQYLISERNTVKKLGHSEVADHFSMNIDEAGKNGPMRDVEVMREIYRYMYPI